MRNRSERLDVLQIVAQTCLDEAAAIPSEDQIEDARAEAKDGGKKPGPDSTLVRAVAKTKYLATATTAVKEMGTIVRKEFNKTGDELDEQIKAETNVKTLEDWAKKLSRDESRDSRPTTA